MFNHDDFKDRFSKLPLKVQTYFMESSINELLFVPFFPKIFEKGGILNGFEYILPEVMKAKHLNLEAGCEFITDELLEILTDEPLLTEYRAYDKETQLELMLKKSVLPKNQLVRMKQFDKKYFDGFLMKKVGNYQQMIINNKTDTFFDDASRKKVNLIVHHTLEDLSNQLAYIQVKRKKRDAIADKFAEIIFNKIKEYSTGNNIDQLSANLCPIVLFKESPGIQDFFAMEFTTYELVPPGQTPAQNSIITRLKQGMALSSYMRTGDSEDIYHEEYPNQPRAIKIDISPTPEALKHGYLTLPFPELINPKFITSRMKFSLHLKTLYDAYDYHFGSKSHNIYKQRSNFEKTLKKRSDIHLYAAIKRRLHAYMQ